MNAQQQICQRFGAAFLLPLPVTIVGLSGAAGAGQIWNGLRHPVEGQTNGWYIWAGETFSDAEDFFDSVHIEHLPDICPEVLPYLGLGPGWRFLIAPDHVDVWFDEALVDLSN